MKYELSRIEIWPVVKIVFFLSLLLGFFIGILYAGMFLMMDMFSNVALESGFDDYSSFGSGFVVILLIGCTLGFSFLYTLGAMIGVVFYNVLAGSIGGLRFDLQSIDDSKDKKFSVG